MDSEQTKSLLLQSIYNLMLLIKRNKLFKWFGMFVVQRPLNLYGISSHGFNWNIDILCYVRFITIVWANKMYIICIPTEYPIVTIFLPLSSSSSSKFVPCTITQRINILVLILCKRFFVHIFMLLFFFVSFFIM